MQNSGHAINPETGSIRGADGLSPAELRAWITDGARCVRFESCISIVVATVRRQSAVYLTVNWQDRYLRGLGYSLGAVLLGPWGIPWGPLWTVWAVWVNLSGGIDVTDAVLRHLDEVNVVAGAGE